ncbi:MAG: MATE family efflux transporter [Dysgonamonadaceae bacterium]|jgi:putative MATE family efflux protein|nr:MATE family efflux transporter [Dysgonamonadaceae bacterium]
MQNNATVNRLETQSIGSLLWSYSVPAIVGTMVNATYSVVDRIFIGQGVGAMAISGLALTLPIMLILQAFGMLIGVGSTSRISICLGQKNKEHAEKILGNALLLTFILSGAAIILSLTYMHPILYAFGGSEETIPYAEKFLRITIPGSILSTLSFGFNNMMRASGYPKKAMYTMIIGAAANVTLAPVFIFCFRWGIEGAAAATLISMGISTLWVMRHFTGTHSFLRLKKQYIRLDKTVVWSIISIGMSPFLMQIAAGMVNVIINTSLKKYGGDLAVGAYGINCSMGLLLIMFIVGLNQGAQPIVGYNYGAKKYDRVLETTKKAIIAASIVAGIGALCAIFIPRLIIRMFTFDEELIDIASHGLRLMLCAYFVVGFQAVATSFFQCIGMAGKSIFLTLTRQCLLLVPCLLILPPACGLDGVWLAQPLSDVLSAVLTAIFLWYQWKKIKGKTKNEALGTKHEDLPSSDVV